MQLEREQEIWNSLGHLDPYWAILVHPDKKFGKWDTEEFFRIGERDIEQVLSVLDELGHPLHRGAALDFGCGVGRLTRALAQRFETACGVDISAEMIARARDLNRDLENCRFLVNTEDRLTGLADEQFDFVYSIMVLQHVPGAREIERYIREFVRVLRPGGILAFQLPSAIPWKRRIQPRRRLHALLRRLGLSDDFLYQQLHLIPIRMTSMPEDRVTAILESAGGRVLRVTATDHAGPEIESRMYFVTKPDRPARQRPIEAGANA